jgi:orotate phosphoribosyltransferase
MPRGTPDAAIETLRRLRAEGASVARVAVAIKRSEKFVREKARELGVPFPSVNEARRARSDKERSARAKAGLPDEDPKK